MYLEKNFQAFFEQGQGYMVSGNFVEGLINYRTALKYDQDNEALQQSVAWSLKLSNITQTTAYEHEGLIDVLDAKISELGNK